MYTTVQFAVNGRNISKLFFIMRIYILCPHFFGAFCRTNIFANKGTSNNCDVDMSVNMDPRGWLPGGLEF